MEIILSDKQDMVDAISQVAKLPLDGSMMIQIKEYNEKRSDKQRRLQHVWYGVLARAGTTNKKDVELYCKLEFGVPILLRDDPEFSAWWGIALADRPWDIQKAGMRYTPITRLFTVKQNVEYLNEMEQHAWDKGIQLPTRDDLYYTAMGYPRRVQ